MRSLGFMIVILIASLSLSACGGSTAKNVEEEAVETGSLMRSFKLMDDQGRESGSLVINPLGGAELRDMDGNVIGSFAPASEAPKVEKVEEDKTSTED